ncbi:MAG: spore coat protein [Bacillota bacterium]|nr:spore coat protein [Bacillota bacterium]
MLNDYLDPRNAEGMPRMTDAAAALSFLQNAKNGVNLCAMALTESATPEVRAMLRTELMSAINLHSEIADLMVRKGWFYPTDLKKQFQMDIESSRTAAQIAELDLFPYDTSRLGTFATPGK